MLRKTLLLALGAMLAAVWMPNEAQAWGGLRVGYLQGGPNGVYQWGSTAAAGPSGTYSSGYPGVYRYGARSGGSLYGGGYQYVPTAYSGNPAYGFQAGGFSPGGGYSTGFNRAW